MSRDGALPDLALPLRALLVPWGHLALSLLDAEGRQYGADLTVSTRGDGYPDAATVHSTSAGHALYSLRTVARPIDWTPNHLPHAGGVRAQLTVHAGLEVAELVLVWHNAVADEMTAPLATLGDLRILEASLVLPHGWRAVSVTPMPGALEPTDSADAGATTLSLIPPLFEGGEQRAHVLKQQRLKCWRLVLYREGDEQVALELAAKRGRGVAVSGYCPSNPLTPGAWAAALPAPERRSALVQAARARLRADVAKLHQALEAGTGFDYRHTGPLGPFRPWRGSYGGETGGEETGVQAGVEAVLAACSEGLVWHATLAEMMLDRAGGWLVDLAGEPTPCDAAVAGGTGANYELRPSGPGSGPCPYWLSGKDPLGFVNPLPENTRPGGAPSASYVQELEAYGTHDHQHLRRTTYHLEALLILEADPMAAWLLECTAAAVVASWNDRGPHQYGSTLGWLHQASKDHRRGLGAPYGRDLAHNVYTVALAATLHPPGGDWPAHRRDRYVEWIRKALEALVRLQGSHGIAYALTWGKPAQDLGNRGDVTQFYEHSMALVAVRAAVFAWLGGLNPQPREVLWNGSLTPAGQVLEELRRWTLEAGRALCAWWREGDVGPYFNAATQPHGNTDPAAVWPSPAAQPEPILTDYADDLYPPAGLAVTLAELTARPEPTPELEQLVLQHAVLFARGNEPLPWLHQQLLRNLATWGTLTGVLEARSDLGFPTTTAMED